MKPVNPFLVTGYYSPEYFCDRERETETIAEALRNGRNITLMAPRRIGKTGLIRNVFNKLARERSGVVTLYMDIFPTQNLTDFVRLLAATVLGSLDSAPRKAVARVTRFVRTCRPAFSFDPLTGAPKITLDIAADNREATLGEIFEYLASAEKRCYIAVDEFQQIGQYPEKGTEALLRSYIQFVPNVSFVFSGSKQHVMQEMFSSAKRPFYQSTQVVTIGRIGKEEYYDFASGFFDRQGFGLAREVFDRIYDRFEGYTWYVQCVLNRLYGYRRTPDEELAAEAVRQIVEESAYSYENLLVAYTSVAVKLLKAIAKSEPVGEITSGRFIAENDLKAASSVSTALKRLLDNELVYKTPQGYIIYDRFMGIWLREQPY